MSMSTFRSRIISWLNSIVTKYQCEFNPISYVEEYITGDDYELKYLAEDFYHRIFSTGLVKGANLLDVGSGPTMRGAISASKYIQDIYLSDLLPLARTEAEKWLKADPSALDYTTGFKYVAQLERQDDHKILEQRVRGAVKECLPCNVLLDNPLGLGSPLGIEKRKFDVILSSGCLDCLPNLGDFCQAIKNIASLLNPKGYLVLVGTIESTTYTVGAWTFPVVHIDTNFGKKAVQEAGLDIVEIEEHPVKMSSGCSWDFKGMFTLVAIKK